MLSTGLHLTSESTGLDHRADLLLPIGLIDAVNLCRDLQRHAATCCDLDCPIGAFLGRNPAKKREVAFGLRTERKEVARKATMDRSKPVHVFQITLLVI